MATIYKRLTKDGRVRYTAYIRLKGHPKQSQTFDRKADAIRWPSSTKPPSRPAATYSARKQRNGPWWT